jgi:hypothetical protein
LAGAMDESEQVQQVDPVYSEAAVRWASQEAGPGWEDSPDVCMFRGCGNTDMDGRGPVVTRDGAYWKACVSHWEAVYRVHGVLAALGVRAVDRDTPLEELPG